MTLKNYHPASPLIVILADNRDPMQSWKRHVATAGRGGVDVVAAKGTPVYARTSGRMQRRPDNGSAGNSCEFWHDDNPGWRDVFSHLTGYVGEDGQHFDAGKIVAYTGNTGTRDPHLHWHLLDPAGNRRNPWENFSPVDQGRPAPSIEDVIMAKVLTGSDVRFIEQNRTKDNHNYLSIMVFGTGLFHIIKPEERDIFNRLKHVLNETNKSVGIEERYPENAVSVDAWDWDATERVFNPNYGK